MLGRESLSVTATSSRATSTAAPARVTDAADASKSSSTVSRSAPATLAAPFMKLAIWAPVTAASGANVVPSPVPEVMP